MANVQNTTYGDREAACMASVFNPLMLRFRAARRLGAFSRALRQGMTDEQAHIYSDGLYPPTPDDIAFQQRLAEEATGIPGKPFPWVSTIALLYPIMATFYIASYRPAPPFIVVVGYGLANLGYLLCISGIVAGHFRIFHLQKRLHVFLTAAGVFVVGTFLTNIPRS
jgi:hypothetical protein